MSADGAHLTCLKHGNSKNRAEGEERWGGSRGRV